MKQILLFLFIVLYALGQNRLKEKIDIQDGLLQLDKNNYDHAIKIYPRLIILFKTYDCNLCLEYRSKFIELAQQLSEYEIYLGEVIAAENKALSIKMECKSYPSVFYYKHGEKNAFPNEDDPVQLLFEYALQYSYGLVTDLKSLSELQLFKKRSNIAVFSYNQDDQLSEIALKNKGIKFATVTDPTVRSTAAYVIVNKALSNEILFNGTLHELDDFINKNAYPLVFSFTEEEFKKAEKDQLPLIGVIIDPKATNPAFIHNYKELASQFEGQLRFLLIDWNDELTLKRFKFYVGQFLEFNRIYYYNYYKQYTRNQNYDWSMTIQKLKKIITDVQSYQEPFWEGDGYVHELTPLNFNSQINENPNHVVVFSYIPGCDICFGFNEIFTELVKKFEHYPHIVFAKHNYRDNRINEIFIERIPALHLYQKINGQINPIRYEGEQTVLSIAQSIENLLITETEKIEVQQEIKLDIDTPKSSSDINTGRVIKLTSDTFESDVINSNHHVFVKFYAPWCGHCQQMAQEYELLAQVYKGNNNIVIAEIDWTIHQVQSIKINGFPTLILFYKENSQFEQIQYKGQRTAQKMKQFIDDQMSDPNDEL